MKRIVSENYSGFQPKATSQILVIKQSEYREYPEISVTGDAPKVVIRLFEEGISQKRNITTWPVYIAKSAKKWYPNEVITEFLLNKLGGVFGIKTADSKLVMINGQLRFLSRNFLPQNKKLQLIHGAEIFSGYLEDEKFVNEIEYQNQSRDYFTVYFVYEALRNFYKEEADVIFKSFVRMLLFDAWVGNNDRHYYNWGVIKDWNNKITPAFSPVYDTARALFWNNNEVFISKLLSDKALKTKKLETYIYSSSPKIGWENEKDINHFKLVKLIFDHEIAMSKSEIRQIFSNSLAVRSNQLIQNQFNTLFSVQRQKLITECLYLRTERILEIIK